MNKKTWFQSAALSAVIFAFTVLLPVSASAATRLTVTPAGDDGGRCIRTALLEAKENASASNPYEITVTPGNYSLQVELPIYSHTTLIMNGVTLTRTRADYNMIRTGDQVSIEGSAGDTGYCYTDIRLVGGTWDGGGGYGTMLKFAHASNVTLEGVTVQNIVDGHEVEVAATDGFTCRSCTFRDQKVSKKGAGEEKHTCYETIQLDILIKGHFKGYRAEAIALKNILIDGCTFENAPRGVGSHTAFLNLPHSHITVQNCTFRNMGSCAAQFMYCSDVTVKNNTITDSPRGIAIYGIMPENNSSDSGIYRASAIKYNGLQNNISDSYRKGLLTDYHITDNQISLSGTDVYAGYDPLGIVVYGTSVKKKTAAKSDGSGGIPKGDYYISGVEISGNTITGKGYGIRCFNTRNAEILDNTITGIVKNDSKDFYPINIKNGCKDLVIRKNTIENADSNAVYIMNSSVSSISENGISVSGKYGIALEEGAKAGSISNNSISNTKHTGISLLNSCSAKSISKNTIKSSGKHGILLEKSTANSIAGNQIETTGSTGNGIYLFSGSSAATVGSNTVSKTGKYGIALEVSSAGKISKNKISNTGQTGISLLNSCSAKNITGNTVTNAKKHGIFLQKSRAGKITGNKITGTAAKQKGNGIYLLNGCQADVLSQNTVSGTDKYGIALEKSTAGKIDKNKVSDTGHTGISLLNKCSADSISGNTVKRTAKHGISLAKNCTAGTVKGNSISEIPAGGRAVNCDRSSKITTLKE